MIVDNRSVDISAASGKADAASFLLAGLGVIHADGNSIAAEQKLRDDGVGGSVTDLDFGELKEMLATLQSCTNVRIDLIDDDNEGALRKLFLDVSEQLGKKRASEDERTDLQSPFILALGDLVDIMASQPEERKSRLKMGYR